MPKQKTKKAPEPEVEEIEDEVELEELDEDVEEEAPTKSKSKANDEVKFGASDLAKLANEKFGKTYDAKTIRTLLRKLARSGKLNREISPENRTRYSWEGPDDPEVRMILKEIKGGAIEAARNEALQKLKDQKAAKDAAKPKKTAKVTTPPPDDDDDVEDLEDDDE